MGPRRTPETRLVCQPEKVFFLGYVVSSQGIRIEKKRINAIKAWPEPKLVQDIQVFIGFAIFY